MYADIVQDGGAMPADGATMEVFVEGWIRNRSVFVAWQGEQVVGSTSCGRSVRRGRWATPR